MESPGCEKSTLLLALIAGLSVNGSCVALFSAIIPFSIFPFIALVLVIYCLYLRYQNRSMSSGILKLSLGCFLLGILGYSAILRAEYPQIGSNFLLSVFCVALVLWIGVHLKKRNTIAP